MPTLEVANSEQYGNAVITDQNGASGAAGEAKAPENILNLAQTILEQTKSIDTYFRDNGLHQTTFSTAYTEPETTPQLVALQDRLRASLEDLRYLVDGPTKFYRSFFMTHYILAAFQVALEFDFFTIVPATGGISLTELADKAGLDLDRTSRIVRYLVTHRLFHEPRQGFITHNAFSISMQDKELRSVLHYSFDETMKASVDAADALKAEPYKADSLHCPFKWRHGVPIFDFYGKYPPKADRFAKAMAAYRRMENSIVELRDYFPWGKLKGTVVDIGGGSGHVSMKLAEQFPHLHFVVQDGSADMLADGKRLLTDGIRSRISFQQQNFFKPQPIRNAAAFLIRQCTHNWADHDVVRMFKSVVPGLEGSASDTALLINDLVMPEPGDVPRLKERAIREADMVMMVCFGAKQRTLAEFETLLKEADPRYEIRKVHETGALGVLEVYLMRGQSRTT
ncbi:O-methyltransferase [Diaporthe helianthi]|uniref:O-methyltransferase n=1 Tax=Diaporthe helianthi TaxID=158607 RepID=A0A2P5HUS7_DIAHE|nr:O-methyltransferase [Diaporthe helianthi]